MAQKDVDDLFAKTLIGDFDDHEPWDAVHALRRIGSREVFDQAAAWCLSDDPMKRARGVDVLAQLGKTAEHPSNSFPDESFQTVVHLLRREKELRPLGSAIYALGHLDNPLASPLVTQYQSHPDADIRHAVAFALGCFPNDPQAIQALLMLAQDPDDDVRDWATFALGVLSDADSPEIRDALFSRIGDSNKGAHEEAMSGLGKTRDIRVLPALITTLEQPPVSDPIIEAAWQMLGMEKERDDWGPAEYVAALRERFSQQAR